MKRPQRALITGGAGFIGSHLSELLVKRGWDVTIIDDLSTGDLRNVESLREHPRFHLVRDTIANEVVMDRLVSECDMVFHLAAAVGVQLIVQDAVRTIETNILGSELVLKTANRYRKKVLLASTSEVYGKTTKTPFREDDDMVFGPTSKSRWSYACSKAIDEFLGLAYRKKYNLPVVIVRFFNTVGPRQTGAYGMVIPRFVRQALIGEDLTIYGDGKQTRCFANVADIVRGVVALAEEPRAEGEVFNLGATEEISVEELARRIVRLTGSRSKLVYIPYDRAYESGFEDMRRRVPDISKAARLVGYKPRIRLDETIRQVAAHIRQQLQSEKGQQASRRPTSRGQGA